jgi:hypothetical protein
MLCLSAIAQEQKEAFQQPKAGDFTLSATVGYNSYANITALSGLLTTYEAEALSTNWTDKKLMVGIEFGVFAGRGWKFSLAGGINFTNRPGYSGVPGTIDENANAEENMGEIPSYRAVADAYSFAYNATLGIDKYFRVKPTSRLMPYIGLRLGGAYGLNEMKYDEYVSMGKSTAETYNLRAAIALGMDYFISSSLYVGVQVEPVAYTYHTTTYKPQEGLSNLSADSHNYSFLAAPTVKLGFKF